MEPQRDDFKSAIGSACLQVACVDPIEPPFRVEMVVGRGFDRILLDTDFAPKEPPIADNRLSSGRAFRPLAPRLAA